MGEVAVTSAYEVAAAITSGSITWKSRMNKQFCVSECRAACRDIVTTLTNWPCTPATADDLTAAGGVTLHMAEKAKAEAARQQPIQRITKAINNEETTSSP